MLYLFINFNLNNVFLDAIPKKGYLYIKRLYSLLFLTYTELHVIHVKKNHNNNFCHANSI